MNRTTAASNAATLPIVPVAENEGQRSTAPRQKAVPNEAAGYDTELHTASLACKQILAKLQMLSDVPAQAIRTEGQLVHGGRSTGLRTRDRHGMGAKGNRSAGSRMPAGVRGRHDDPSERDLSLFHYYLARMKEAIAHATTSRA